MSRALRSFVGTSAAVVLAAATTPLHAQNWTGAGGNSLWSNPANWDGGVAPVSSPGTFISLPNVSTSNDFAGTFGVQFIESTATTPGLTNFRGNPLRFGSPGGSAGIFSSGLTPNSVLRFNMEVDSPAGMLIILGPTDSIEFLGRYTNSSSSGFTLNGGGSVTFAEDFNVVSEFDVNGGSEVILGGLTETFSPTLPLPTVILRDGVLRPTNGSPSIGDLAFDDGRISPFFFGVSVRVTGNLTARQPVASLSGPLTLSPGDHVVSHVDDPFLPDLKPLVTLNSNISGPGGLRFTNTTVSLTSSPTQLGTHTYTGNTQLVGSTVTVAASGVLSPGSPFTLDASSTLAFAGTTQNVLSINSAGTLRLDNANLVLGGGTSAPQTLGGTLLASNGTLTKAGTGSLTFAPTSLVVSPGTTFTVNLTQGQFVSNLAGINTLSTAFGTEVRVDSAANLNSPVRLTGTGQLLKRGTGQLLLPGDLSAFNGSFSIEGGELALDANVTPAFTSVGPGAVLRVGQNRTLGGAVFVAGTALAPGNLSGSVTVAGGGLLSVGGTRLVSPQSTVATLQVLVGGTVSAASPFGTPRVQSGTIQPGGIFQSDFSNLVNLQTGERTPFAERMIFDQLTLAGGPQSPPVIIRIAAGDFVGYQPHLPQHYLILTALNAPFTPETLARLSLDTTAFEATNPLFGAGVALFTPNGSDLYLAFSPPVIPEPGAVVGMLPALMLGRRPRRSPHGL